MVGRSTRNSWPGLAHLTSTPRVLPAMRPCPRSALTRSSRPSVPSIAFERDGAAADRDRRLADVERADGARRGERPPRCRASRAFCGATLVIGPSEASRSGTISCAPTTLMPFASSHGSKRAQHAVIALRERDQRARQKRKQRKAGLERGQFGRRPMPPANTTWVTPRRFSSGRKAGEILERQHPHGRRLQDSALASPCTITTKGGWPCAARLSARSTGSLPLPATMATLSPGRS